MLYIIIPPHIRTYFLSVSCFKPLCLMEWVLLTLMDKKTEVQVERILHS